jgi:hypothetical protein
MSVPGFNMPKMDKRGDLMNPQRIFDGYLLKKDTEGAFEWVMEKLAWDPESSDLLGMGSFAFYLLDDNRMAGSLAMDALRKDPDNEWALATIFATTYRLDDVLSRFHFHTDEGFCLGPTWLWRFTALGHPEEARQLAYCLSRYGSPRQKVLLSEDWLVRKQNPAVPTAQLELDLKEKAEKKS